jgi:hypothetical protein
MENRKRQFIASNGKPYYANGIVTDKTLFRWLGLAPKQKVMLFPTLADGENICRECGVYYEPGKTGGKHYCISCRKPIYIEPNKKSMGKILLI